MATKTFKIGLSNTDKQNMAQDVYERLLALTFPEYDTTTSYEVGDFVVYNDQLYKCIGATSGAWDSTKWQLATLNDLLTDIEDAVQFVNDKANVDGNYPTMTVGVADQLSPYDESAGDDQDDTFSFQATGTGNGTQADFATGAVALMKEKQGNTVVVNQLVQNGTFTNTSNWTTTNCSLTVSNNVASITATAQWGRITQSISIVNGHKYLIIASIKGTTDNYISAFGTSSYVSADNVWENKFFIHTATATESDVIHCGDKRASDWTEFNVKNVSLIDLTQWFNGDIPADLLSHPENFFRYYQGSLAYNEGTLVNANSRYLKAIGRNQWDEEWEEGGINASTGENESGVNAIRSKNYIRVIPNVTYLFKVSVGDPNIYFYDKDKNYISPLQIDLNSTFTVPSNCCFIRIRTNTSYGTTYNHDITISLYYEDESGYDQYYPYEVLTNNDTGTETLRSAGSVTDSKAPDGTITRRVGTYTFTGSESWVSRGNDTNCDYYYLYLDIPRATQNQFTNGNLISNKAIAGNSYSGNIPNLIGIDMNTLYVSVPTGTNPQTIFTSGTVLFYELATPTTEQGTSYSENIVIDDFGSMSFEGTSGVPQGNLIFYPVDYKAFIDTLYDYTEGTPSNIALKSDLSDYQPIMQDLSSEITEVAAGLTYAIKKAYKTGNLVSLSIRATNSTGNSISANETLFKLTGDLKPTFAGYAVAIVGCIGDNPVRFQIDYSSGDVSCVSSIANNAGIHLYVTFAIA